MPLQQFALCQGSHCRYYSDSTNNFLIKPSFPQMFFSSQQWSYFLVAIPQQASGSRNCRTSKLKADSSADSTKFYSHDNANQKTQTLCNFHYHLKFQKLIQFDVTQTVLFLHKFYLILLQLPNVYDISSPHSTVLYYTFEVHIKDVIQKQYFSSIKQVKMKENYDTQCWPDTLSCLVEGTVPPLWKTPC